MKNAWRLAVAVVAASAMVACGGGKGSSRGGGKGASRPLSASFRAVAPSKDATEVSLNPVFSWEPSAGAESYALKVWEAGHIVGEEREVSQKSCVVDEHAIRGTTHTAATTLRPATRYFWQVSASTRGGGRIAEGAPWSFITEIHQPASFSLLSPAGDDRKVSVKPTFAWTPSEGAFHYVLEIADTTDFTGASAIRVENLRVTEHTLERLLPVSRDFYWRVTAHTPKGTVVALGSPSKFTTTVLQARAWGWNPEGQVGNGSWLSDDEKNGEEFPVKVMRDWSKSLEGIVTLSLGPVHSLALLSDGTVTACGLNQNGELGSGDRGRKTRMEPVQDGRTGLPLSRVRLVTAGYGHSLAVLENGDIVWWGIRTAAQFGGPESRLKAAPISAQETEGLTEIDALAAGFSHYVALQNGQIFTWGNNDQGQLGNGHITGDRPQAVRDVEADRPVQGVTAIASGENHSLALADGKVLAWGRNKEGQLGNGAFVNQTRPVYVVDEQKAPLTDIVAIAANWDNSIALKRDGTIYLWGANEKGQLGADQTPMSSHAIALKDAQNATVTGAAGIAIGRYHGIAMMKDGTAIAWGDNRAGQLARGHYEPMRGAVQVRDESGNPLRDIRGVAAGGGHSMVILAE